MREIHHYIDGAARSGTDAERLPVFDPATGHSQAQVDRADRTVVDDAVASAVRALPAWSTTSTAARTEVMFAFREILAGRRDELAAAVTSEHGKVLSDAGGEVARALENVEFACGIGQHLKGEISQEASTGIDVHTVRYPLGVVAGITPFNFPAMVPVWMFSTAIACGNTFVLKPSERDPSASMLLAAWAVEAGLPPGVLNVVHGDREAVDALLHHDDVAGVSFVGSTPIARHVFATATAQGKRVQALGGAKNHMVVLPDADLDMAADAAVSAAYGSAGERCMAISVLVAVGDIGDELVRAIADRLPSISVGPGTDPDTEMGPLITAQHRDAVVGHIEGADDAGATIVVDGRNGDHPSDGFFLGPTLVDHVDPMMECYRQEIFGPVLVVVRAATFDDAVSLINANPYGNGTAIFTRDGGAARRFEERVDVGMIGVNVAIPVPVAYHSFGGWKASLFGDGHMYGPEGVRFFTRPKVVTSRWPDPSSSVVDLGFPTNE